MNGAEVRVYSLAKDGHKYITPHFQVKEFACHDKSDTIFVSYKLPLLLEQIRTAAGNKPVKINSGYRTDYYNSKTQGSAQFSQHLYGMAADITIPGVTPKQIAAIAEKLMPNAGGIGIYSAFCHVDVRPQKSRWNG